MSTKAYAKQVAEAIMKVRGDALYSPDADILDQAEPEEVTCLVLQALTLLEQASYLMKLAALKANS